jgi:hypothetical protein
MQSLASSTALFQSASPAYEALVVVKGQWCQRFHCFMLGKRDLHIMLCSNIPSIGEKDMILWIQLNRFCVVFNRFWKILTGKRYVSESTVELKVRKKEK